MKNNISNKKNQLPKCLIEFKEKQKADYLKELLKVSRATFDLLRSPHGEAIKKAHPNMVDELFEMTKEYNQLTKKQ